MITLLLKLLVAIGVPALLSLTPTPPNLAEKLLIGAVTFIGWTVLETLVHVRRVDERDKRDHDLWRITDEFDAVLQNLRCHYTAAARDFHSKSDLFRDHLDALIQEVDATLRRAAETKELVVRNYHFRSTELVLAAFEGDPAKTLCYVWILDEPLLDDMWRHYLRQVDDLVVRRRFLKKVRALLLYDRKEDLDKEPFRAVLGFYACSQNYEYRLMERASYERIKKDDNLEAEYLDFGIYGHRYLYLTQSYGDEVKGVFTKSKATIDRYTRFFDNTWKSPRAWEYPDKEKLPRLSVADLCNLKI